MVTKREDVSLSLPPHLLGYKQEINNLSKMSRSEISEKPDRIIFYTKCKTTGKVQVSKWKFKDEKRIYPIVQVPKWCFDLI